LYLRSPWSDCEQPKGEGTILSELEAKLRAFKTTPQSKESALQRVRRLKAEVGMEDVKSDKNEVKAILRKAGSLSDEIIELRKNERK